MRARTPIFQDVFNTNYSFICRSVEQSGTAAQSTVRLKQAKAKCSIIYNNPITLLILLRLNATDISYT